MGQSKWTIQRNCMETLGKQDDEKQSKNTTQYVLDITIRKQTQIINNFELNKN